MKSIKTIKKGPNIGLKKNYSEPKISKGKSWYIWFIFQDKQFRIKGGLNYIKNIKQKERYAEGLRFSTLEKLKSGWNPNLPDNLIIQEEYDFTFIDALDFALEKKKINLAPKTYLGYRGTTDFCKTSISSLKLDKLLIKDTKRVHIKNILENVKEQRKWSNKAYNKNLGYLQAILSELIQWDIIEHNPAHKIKPLKVGVSRANIPPNPYQHEVIKEELFKNHPNFFLYIITIFHTGIRPKEILDITMNMIDLDKKQFILPPGITKTDKERIVPINDHLLKYFKMLNLCQYPKGYYLFGSFRKKGRGNIGKHLDFIPGPTKIKRDTATRRWRNIVKLSLGVDVNMYAMKHFGADMKILAGIDLDALKELYGHASKLTTTTYVSVIKEVHRKQIMEKSPSF